MKITDSIHAFLWSNPSVNNCNTYLIAGTRNILIDPGHHHLFNHVNDELERLSLYPEDLDIVIITHGHPDHIEGVRDFVDSSTIIAISEIEMRFIRDTAPHYGDALGVSGFEPGIMLREGILETGDSTLKVIHAPGHSPGSICLYLPNEKVLFTGDVVFNQGLGRTDLPGGNGEELKRSIKNLSDLDVEYLLPGHGDIVTGKQKVETNFSDIERMWFEYL